jgi:hypothetical protein
VVQTLEVKKELISEGSQKGSSLQKRFVGFGWKTTQTFKLRQK